MTLFVKLCTCNCNLFYPSKFPKCLVLFSVFLGGAALALSVICLPFVSPALRRVCLPYVPATNSQVENVLKALRGRSGRFVDLGSGDGRIVRLSSYRNYLIVYVMFQRI